MMRNRHGRGRQRRTQPRFGGHNPLKVLAILAGIAVGGVVAAGAVGLLKLVLAIIGLATAAASGLLLYGWIIAAYLIYRAIRSRYANKEYAYRYEDDAPAWKQQFDREWEREWAKERAKAESRSRQTSKRPDTRPDTRPVEQRQRGIGTVTVAVLGGLLLALGANVGLSALNLSPMASTLLPALAGAGVGVGIYATLNRWVMPPIEHEKPPAREVRAQLGRIKRKAKLLSREAKAAGGVFNDLDYQADRLTSEAAALCDRLFELRAIARDARREFGNPPRPEGVPAQPESAEAWAALHAAQEAQKRLDALLARNRGMQQQCLVGIERIEDVLDVARLEIACPEGTATTERAPERLVQEVETELEAARRALAEVQRETQVL